MGEKGATQTETLTGAGAKTWKEVFVAKGRNRDDALAGHVIKAKFIGGVRSGAIVVVVATLCTWRSELVGKWGESRASNLDEEVGGNF